MGWSWGSGGERQEVEEAFSRPGQGRGGWADARRAQLSCGGKRTSARGQDAEHTGLELWSLEAWRVSLCPRGHGLSCICGLGIKFTRVSVMASALRPRRGVLSITEGNAC